MKDNTVKEEKNNISSMRGKIMIYLGLFYFLFDFYIFLFFVKVMLMMVKFRIRKNFKGKKKVGRRNWGSVFFRKWRKRLRVWEFPLNSIQNNSGVFETWKFWKSKIFSSTCASPLLCTYSYYFFVSFCRCYYRRGLSKNQPKSKSFNCNHSNLPPKDIWNINLEPILFSCIKYF